MADVEKAKRNVRRMIDGGASEAEIDTYLGSQGLKPADLRKPPSGAAKALADARKRVSTAPDAVRAFSGGSAFGFADELDALAAGGETGLRNLAARTGLVKPAGYTAAEARAAVMRANREADQAANPAVMLAGNIAGGLATGGAFRAPAALATALPANAIARGALIGGAQGALYGAGTAEGDLGERAKGAALGGALGGATGGLLGKLTSRVPPTTPKPPSARQTLAQIGVQTMPTQANAAAKGVEDLAMRVPVLGQAIQGSRARQVEQLNRGIGLRALEPIGEKLDKGVKPGFEMVRAVEDKLSSVYDDALSRVTNAAPDQQLANDLGTIAARKIDLLPDEANLFDKAVGERVKRLMNGQATGETLKEVQSQLRTLAREQTRKGNATLADMLDDAARAVIGIAERNDPQIASMIQSADRGWSVYKIMNAAAARASNREGVFLPGQLNTEVKRAGKYLGPNMTGKGLAPLQDISTAASQLIPDSFGNPGTANALMQVGAGGVGLSALTGNPVSVGIVGGGLAASTPYFLAARKVLERLPPNPSAAQISQARQVLNQLAKNDPAVKALQQALVQIEARGIAPQVVSGALAQEEQPQ